MKHEPTSLGDVIGKITKDLGVMPSQLLERVDSVCEEVLGEHFFKRITLQKVSLASLVFELSHEQSLYLEIRRSQLGQRLREIGYDGEIIVVRTSRR